MNVTFFFPEYEEESSKKTFFLLTRLFLLPRDILRGQIEALEQERDNLGVELQFMKDKIRAVKLDNDRLVKVRSSAGRSFPGIPWGRRNQCTSFLFSRAQESDELKLRLERAAHDASDILEHKQVEIQQKEDQILALENRSRALAAELA